MKRRKFITQTVAAAGAFTVPFILSDTFAQTIDTVSGASMPSSGFRKSIMWGGVRVEGSVADKCKAVKAAGFEGIEPNSHMDRAEVIDAMKANGLVASSVCCSTHWRIPIASAVASERQEGVEGAIVALEDAKAYGTDAMLLVAGVVSESVSYDECWERCVESIKKLIPVAERLNVKICIENVVSNNFLPSPMEMVRFIDQFNSPYVQCYFDVGNCCHYGWPEHWLRILGRRIARVHIKEWSWQEAATNGWRAGYNVPLTEGDINWQRVIEETRKVYHAGWMTTEQGSCRTLDELEDLNGRLDKIIAL